MIKLGQDAPDFQAKDQEGREHRLSDYKGQWVLLYFYPKDDTPGCTQEACSLRDKFDSFKNLKAVVLGVSTDSEASHARFSKKYNLPFTLLADPNKKVVSLYEAGGLFRRVSYLISPELKIVKVYPRVKPAIHATEVIRDLELCGEN